MYGKSSLPRVFAKRVLVCTSCSDSRTTWRNYATNWSTPTLPPLSAFHRGCPAPALLASPSSVVDCTADLEALEEITLAALLLRARLLLTDHVRLWNVSPPVAYIVAPLSTQFQPQGMLSLTLRRDPRALLNETDLRGISPMITGLSNTFGSKKISRTRRFLRIFKNLKVLILGTFFLTNATSKRDR